MVLDIRRTVRFFGATGAACAALVVAAMPAAAQQPDSSLSASIDSAAASLAVLLGQRVAAATEVSAASKYAQSLSEAPGSITVITAAEIERAGWRNLAQVLATVRGLYVTSDRGYDFVGVRGFGRLNDYNNAILLLLNGHTINDPVYGSALLGSDFEIDPRSIDHIEIIRGPGSALYGTGAVHAVIDIVLKAGDALRGVTLGAEAASLGRRGVRLQAGTGRADARVAVHALLDRADGDAVIRFPELATPLNNNGIARDRDFERRRSVAVTGTLGHFTLLASVLDRDKGVPLPYFDTLLTVPGAVFSDTYINADLRYAADVRPDLHVMARGYGDRYRYTSRPGTRDVMFASPALEDSRGVVAGTEANVTWDARSSLRLTGGGEYRRIFTSRIQNAVGAPFTISLPYSIASGYAEADWQLVPAVALLAAVRHDDYSRAGSATTPRFALSWRATRRFTAKLLYGEAFRAPSTYEIGGDGFQVLPNPALKPTRIRSTEVATTWQPAPTVTVSTAAYWYHVYGIVGDSVLNEATGTSINANLSDARGLGLEFGIQYRAPGGIGAYAQYAFSDAETVPSNTQLSNSPGHVVQAGLDAPLGAWLVGAAELQGLSERSTWDGTPVPGAVIANAHLAFRPPLAGGDRRRLEISLRAQNLFDRAYASPVAAFAAPVTSIVQQGRVFSLQVRVQP